MISFSAQDTGFIKVLPSRALLVCISPSSHGEDSVSLPEVGGIVLEHLDIVIAVYAHLDVPRP